MRKTVFRFILVFLLSCQNNQVQTIVVDWQFSESRHGTGSEFITNKVDGDVVLSFDKNGGYREYTNGKHISDRYLITKKDYLVMINSKTKDSTYYSYYFKKNKLILDEVDRNGSFMCDEGCSKIYTKISK